MKSQADGRAEQALEWIAELQRGRDVEANSRRLFESYYGWVRGFFVRRGSARERAEELAQETFLQVFEQLSSFRGEGTFESWLFAIAANRWRQEQRTLGTKMRSGRETSLDTAETDLELVDHSQLPEEKALSKQRQQALQQAVLELPDRAGQCVRLRLAGHGYDEIAELLRLSPSTVRVHVYKARQRLQDALGDRPQESRRGGG